MPEDNQPKPSSWEEEIFESIDPGAEEKKREFLKQGTSWLRSVAPHPTADWIGPHSGLNFGPLEFKQKQTPLPAPEITPTSLLYSLQVFDAIVQKVVEINAGRWIFPEDAPILVRAVLKAIVEVNNERNERQNQR
jgi:hypothetical protein